MSEQQPKLHLPTAHLLTPTEAARYLALSVSTLERFRVTGNGPAFVKLGTARTAPVRYKFDDLESWVASGRRPATGYRFGG